MHLSVIIVIFLKTLESVSWSAVFVCVVKEAIYRGANLGTRRSLKSGREVPRRRDLGHKADASNGANIQRTTCMLDSPPWPGQASKLERKVQSESSQKREGRI